MGVCSLRILTAAIDLGRNYYTIPLSDKKAYSVSNEVTGTETFSIKAFSVDDKGAVTGEGALPSAIRYYLGSEKCKDIKISSKTGTCYAMWRSRGNEPVPQLRSWAKLNHSFHSLPASA
jgi:hypothetical protein